jgi:hypothetical protein
MQSSTFGQSLLEPLPEKKVSVRKYKSSLYNSNNRCQLPKWQEIEAEAEVKAEVQNTVEIESEGESENENEVENEFEGQGECEVENENEGTVNKPACASVPMLFLMTRYQNKLKGNSNLNS